MAKKTVYVSDLSGQSIEEGRGATITVKFADARRGVYVIDATDQEAEDLGSKGRKQSRRGRPAKVVGGV